MSRENSEGAFIDWGWLGYPEEAADRAVLRQRLGAMRSGIRCKQKKAVPPLRMSPKLSNIPQNYGPWSMQEMHEGMGERTGVSSVQHSASIDKTKQPTCTAPQVEEKKCCRA